MNKINVVYFGTPDFSTIILDNLIKDKRFNIKAVVTNPDRPIGRRQTLKESPAAKLAKEHKIPVLKPEKLDEGFIKNHLSLLDTDLYIIFSYGKILPKSLLEIPKLGALNIHPSLLPKYRGPSPIQTALLNGDKKTGVTIILMDEKMDHGFILSTKELRLSGKETYESLSKKMAHIGSQLLMDTLVKFLLSKIKYKPQSHKKATYTKLIKKDDGYFDINKPPSSETLDKTVRAYYPWPNVWTKWKGKIVKFLPGDLIQMEGKRSMPIKDFLNGYSDFPMKQI